MLLSRSDKKVKIREISKRLSNRINDYIAVFCGELVNYDVFHICYTKEGKSSFFQLHFIPKMGEMIRDLMYENFPHLHSPEDYQVHFFKCGGFHFWGLLPNKS